MAPGCNNLLKSLILLSLLTMCLSENTETCVRDSDCLNAPFFECHKNLCTHKGPFPVLGVEIGGIFVLTLLLALSNMAGIGGGGIIVPLLMAFFKFETKDAIPISGFTILIGSLTRFFVNIGEMHPDGQSVVIDYNISIIMLPIVIIGS